jgi:arabinofuranan 3-O-arabinosyltransferase
MSADAVMAGAAPAPRVIATVRTGRAARVLMWTALVVAFLALPFLSLPGRYVPDTRDAVWFDPGTYVRESFTLWQANPNLGAEQRDDIVVPMGAVVAALRYTGLPIWAVERLWHGLLLLAGAAGMVLLMDQLRGRRTVLAGLTAALVYVLTPYAFRYGLATTGAFVPYVLLPWLLLVTARWAGRPGLVGPVLFGLTTFLMGGGNGAPQIYAVATCALLVLWLVAVERSLSLVSALRFGLWSALFAVGLNAYWLLSLSSSNVGNALAFSEQSNQINLASSYSESIRGVGFWVYYGGDRFGPWAPSIQRFVTAPGFIVAEFAAPVAALLSAWLVRWRYRLFFLFLMVLAVLVMAGTFPVTSPTPFGRFLRFAYDHVPGSAGLRTTYKFGGALFLAMAVLIGVGMEAAWRWASGRWVARTLVIAPLVVVLAVVGSPLWAGSLYDPSNATSGLPVYWERALRWLHDHEEGGRALFLPAAVQPAYTWGQLHDGVPQTDPDLAAVDPFRVPQGERYGSNLVAAAEWPIQHALGSTDAATVYRYLGVGHVVLQNDLDWRRAGAVRPAGLQAVADDPSLAAGPTFGTPGANVERAAPDALTAPADRRERHLPPVQVLTVPSPLPTARAESLHPVLMSGDGFGIVSAAREGLLAGNPPILYSGTLAADQVAALGADHPSIVITDSNRRRRWSFAGVRNNASATLPADQTGGDSSAVAYGLFDGRVDTQSVAVYEGVASITASGYGSPLGFQNELRPVNAFDGDPSTWWLVGGLGDPVGAWIQATFHEERPVDRARIVLPQLGFGRQVEDVGLEFSDGTSVRRTLHRGVNDLRFPSRTSSYLRLRVLSVTGDPFSNAVGFADVHVPGIAVREMIRTPTDLVVDAAHDDRVRALLAAAPLTYLFERSRTGTPLTRDEEPGIQRLFDVAADRSFGLRVAGHLDRFAPDDQIDRLVGGTGDVVATSSSRLLSAPQVRASQAIDGDPDTAWVPQGTVDQWVRFAFPVHEVSRLDVDTQRGFGRTPITDLLATFSDGSTVVLHVDPKDGVARARFPARAVTSLTLRVTGATPPPTQRTPPVAISEVRVPGVRIAPVAADTPLGCTVTSFALDGRPVALEAAATVGELLSGRAVDYTTCGDVQLALGAGQHALVARGTLQPDSVTLSSPGESAPEAPSPPPAIRTASRPGAGLQVDVRGASAPYYLVTGQNVAAGWRASIEGDDLGPPMVVDGYSAGWRIDRPGSYRVVVSYAPQERFAMALAVTVATLLAALAVLALAWLRRDR